MDAVKTPIEKAEERRDLRAQLGNVGADDYGDVQEIVFKETSPRRRHSTIYAVRNGQPATMPLYMAEKALDKIDPDTGTYMFTANAENAPEYKLGNIFCFLHAESPEQPILAELGLSGTPCRKATLMNPHSKRMHALHRHPQEWEAYQDFLDNKKESDANERQEKQLSATLALAGRAVGAPAVEAAEEAPAAPEAKERHCRTCNEVITGFIGNHKCAEAAQS